ncbi:MAG TPA: bifunctional nuclease family protein [Deltaproteobacteria bacterium]|nr:bifunctional nuclease family protein [Deltaproteobacteria bacterium]
MESNEFAEIKEVFVKTDRTQGNMVILKRSEEDSYYFLMFVGDAEITEIAKEKGLVEPKRPLTHDIYLTILKRTGATFEKIVISEMRDNTFYAKIYVHINGEVVDFDARPSDAVALALHEKCPIWVNKRLLRVELTPEEVQEFEMIVKTVKF